MDRFWIFLEALAGILEDRQATEGLKQHLMQMPPAERSRMKNYLRIVAETIPRLAADSELS
jgi:hypothetical protein